MRFHTSFVQPVAVDVGLPHALRRHAASKRAHRPGFWPVLMANDRHCPLARHRALHSAGVPKPVSNFSSLAPQLQLVATCV